MVIFYTEVLSILFTYSFVYFRNFDYFHFVDVINYTSSWNSNIFPFLAGVVIKQVSLVYGGGGGMELFFASSQSYIYLLNYLRNMQCIKYLERLVGAA